MPIDPPYNTGEERWVYNDNVNSPEIKGWINQVVGKEAEDLSRHDKWLCMRYPRLALLRLPRARRKQRAELNCAYVFAVSPRFIEAASALKDALVKNGFQRMEASDLVKPQEETDSLFGAGTLFARASQVVSQRPDFTNLDLSIRSRVSYDETTSQLSMTGVISEQEAEALQSCFTSPEDQAAVKRIFHLSQGHTVVPAPASGQREAFNVPLLAIRIGEQLEFFEESHFLDVAWNLAECDEGLSEIEFPSQHVAGSAGELDVTEAGQVEMRQFVEQLHAQLALLAIEPGWSVTSLVNWLDRQISHLNIPQTQSSLFIHKVVTGLMQSRGLTVEQLARQKFRLRNAIKAKINEHRRSQATRAYTALLFGMDSGNIEVSSELCFSYTEERYSPNWYYEGGLRFRKHYFHTVGELKSFGEEFECAGFLDNRPEVKYWVRNLERRPDSSFWLQTASDRFYPDFVATLADGRILVVEYKGEHLWSNDDSKEKQAVGELWAERSNGRCLFVMPKGTNWSAITAVLNRSPGGRSSGSSG